MTRRLAAFVSLCGLITALFLIVPRAALAQGDGGESHVYANLYVPSGRTIDGDVSIGVGSAQIAGVVTGDCTVIVGTCETVDGGQIMGRVNSAGDWFSRDGIGAHEARLIARLAANAVVILAFLIFPVRARITVDRVERHPGLAALTGLAAAIAVLPIALILTCTVVGIPLVVLEIAAVFGGIWIGTAAIAVIVGRRLCELIAPHGTPSPIVALLVGLVVISAAEIAPLVGWVVTAMVWTIGLGAALLSLARSTRLEAALARAPIGGPPMRR
jgi:hypothetical protein